MIQCFESLCLNIVEIAYYYIFFMLPFFGKPLNRYLQFSYMLSILLLIHISSYIFTYLFPTSYPKSIMGNMISATFSANFNLFTTVHGTFLSGLLYVYHRENGYRISKMTNGTYTKTVCWKHVVKSGLSVYQVTSRSQIKSVQKLWVWLAMSVFDYVDNFCKLM